MMIDDCSLSRVDDDPADEESTPEPKSLINFLPAALIVVLAVMIVSALFENSPRRDGLVTLPESDVTPTQPTTSIRLAAAVPLRPALRDLSMDRTGSLQPALPASMAQAAVIPHERPSRVERRSKVLQNVVAVRPSISRPRPNPRPAGESPLTIVGRTASDMATRFATDLRALPSQISALFKPAARERPTPVLE